MAIFLGIPVWMWGVGVFGAGATATIKGGQEAGAEFGTVTGKATNALLLAGASYLAYKALSK